jgi:hypothetical protein
MFQQYHVTGGYETFIYYDEVATDKHYYIQFMYAGYINGDECNSTFYTNMNEHDDSPPEHVIFSFTQTINHLTVDANIKNILLHHIAVGSGSNINDIELLKK